MIDNIALHTHTHRTMTSRYTAIYFTTQKHTTLVMLENQLRSRMYVTAKTNTLSQHYDSTVSNEPQHLIQKKFKKKTAQYLIP